MSDISPVGLALERDRINALVRQFESLWKGRGLCSNGQDTTASSDDVIVHLLRPRVEHNYVCVNSVIGVRTGAKSLT